MNKIAKFLNSHLMFLILRRGQFIASVLFLFSAGFGIVNGNFSTLTIAFVFLWAILMLQNQRIDAIQDHNRSMHTINMHQLREQLRAMYAACEDEQLKAKMKETLDNMDETLKDYPLKKL